MALRIVRRWSWVPLLACVGGLLQACSSSPVDEDTDTSGCGKDSDCRDGRICDNKVCIDDPNNGAVLGGSSGSGGTTTGSGGTSAPASGGTSFATGGTSAKGGTGSGGSSGSASGAANGGSASGSGGTGGTGGSAAGMGGSSGTSGTETCSEDDPATCPTTDSMTFCSNGKLVTYACTEYCDTLGFPVGPCAAPDGCACDWENPTDEDCIAATNGVCGCFEGTDTPCVDAVDPADPDSIYFYPPYIYASCHGGSKEDMDFLHCIADQTKLDPLPMCVDAFEACGADTGAAGAGG